MATEKSNQSARSISDFAGHDQNPPPTPAPDSILSGWTPRRVATATLVALGVGLLFWLLYRFYMVVFIFFVAITLQLATKPAVLWMRRRGLSPSLAVIVVYLLLLALCIGFLWVAVPLLIEQVTTASQQLPGYYSDFRMSLIESNSRFIRAFSLALPPNLAFLGFAMNSSGAETPENEAVLSMLTSTWQVVKSASYTLFILLSIFMLAYYWTLEGDIITRRALMFASPGRREEIRVIFRAIETKIGDYFRGQFILCLVVATLSVVGYLLIGLPYALGLGLFMGIMEAIPMIGPALGAIPALLIALSATPDKLLWVIAVVSIIQFLENNLLVPRIMDQSVGVNALVTILAIAAFGLLFGIGGAILAIPLAAILQILFNHFVLDIPLDTEGSTTAVATVVDRGKIGALRIEAQDLYNDLRKSNRLAPEGLENNEQLEAADDLLESIAQDLDGLLSQMEEAK